jgi:ketosteroid isomerase-like protein
MRQFTGMTRLRIALAVALLIPLLGSAQERILPPAADPATTTRTGWNRDTSAIAAIDYTLNQLHDAAAKADARRYFSLFTDDAIYIGSDAAERWTLKQFRAYAEPYFNKGTGWTYKPRSRNVVIADVPCRCVAWFDELLDSESYGTSRGTGVLVRKNGSWKISQYALTFPIPNDLANDMTAKIRSFEAGKKKK